MYAKEKYGAYPYFGELDLRKEYLSGDFHHLKISIYHATEKIHVEKRDQWTSDDTEYTWKGNEELVNNRWFLGYRIGATQTETRTETVHEEMDDVRTCRLGVADL